MLRYLLVFILIGFFFAGMTPVSYEAPISVTSPQKSAIEKLPYVSESEETEREHWLAFSALYEVLEHNRVTGYEQLYCQTCRDEDALHRNGLAQSWGIIDRDSALERINRFFEPSRYPSYEQKYQEFLQDRASADKEIINKIDIAETSLAKYLHYGAADFKRVETVAGWDFMRCASMVKAAYNLGYITEEEAWVYLRENAVMAEAVFETWQDYFISFMLGRVISYRTADTDAYVLAARKLFEDPNCEWFNPAIR